MRYKTILAALAGLAVVNYVAARQAERRNPAKGSFLVVDGVRLHYSDRGTGPAVVLIHGNVVTGTDWDISGVAEKLLRNHRVIIFDRPGFGYSERPRGKAWTAAQQAELLFKALKVIGVEQPVVVGHSFGTIVALGMAAHHQADIAGLVLLSGYYFPTLRPDVLMVAPVAMPVLGDLLRATVGPLLGWLQMPMTKWALFSPARPTRRFRAGFSSAMALRPSQIGATATDGALMIPAVLELRSQFPSMTLPVTIMAGDGDRVVFMRRSRQLHETLPQSELQIVPGAGHMVHHSAPNEVAEAIESMAARANPAWALAS